MIGSSLGRFVLSLALGFVGAVFLGPACVSIAHAQVFEGIDSTDGSSTGLTALVLLWATILALATEQIRSMVRPWRRGIRADPAALGAIDHLRTITRAQQTTETERAIELLRRLAVATGGPSDRAKVLLRTVPIVLGVLAPIVMSALPIDQTYNPGLVGGLFAGLCASQFGGSIVKAVRDRFPGARADRTPAPAEDDAS